MADISKKSPDIPAEIPTPEKSPKKAKILKNDTETSITTDQEKIIAPDQEEIVPRSREEIEQAVNERISKEQQELETILETSANLPYKIEINGERWFTRQQLSTVLKCSERTIYNFVNYGRVDVLDVDNMTFYRLNKNFM